MAKQKAPEVGTPEWAKAVQDYADKRIRDARAEWLELGRQQGLTEGRNEVGAKYVEAFRALGLLTKEDVEELIDQRLAAAIRGRHYEED